MVQSRLFNNFLSMSPPKQDGSKSDRNCLTHTCVYTEALNYLTPVVRPTHNYPTTKIKSVPMEQLSKPNFVYDNNTMKGWMASYRQFT